MVKENKQELSEDDEKYIKLFSYTCSGTFGPICAFFGGLVSQEVCKAITGKYSPINQYFLVDFSEVCQKIPSEEEQWEVFVKDKL